MRTEFHHLVRRGDAFLRILWVDHLWQRHAAMEADRQIVLRNLVILRHVRIEIVLAIEFADLRHLAAEHQAGQRRHLQRLPVHYRQGARQPEAHRAGMRVWGPIHTPRGSRRTFCCGSLTGRELQGRWSLRNWASDGREFINPPNINHQSPAKVNSSPCCFSPNPRAQNRAPSPVRNSSPSPPESGH